MGSKLDLRKAEELAVIYEKEGQGKHLYMNFPGYYIANTDGTEIIEITEEEAKNFIKEIMRSMMTNELGKENKKSRINFVQNTMYQFISSTAIYDYTNKPINERKISHFLVNKEAFLKSNLTYTHTTAILLMEAATEILAEEFNDKTTNKHKVQESEYMDDLLDMHLKTKNNNNQIKEWKYNEKNCSKQDSETTRDITKESLKFLKETINKIDESNDVSILTEKVLIKANNIVLGTKQRLAFAEGDKELYKHTYISANGQGILIGTTEYNGLCKQLLKTYLGKEECDSHTIYEGYIPYSLVEKYMEIERLVSNRQEEKPFLLWAKTIRPSDKEEEKTFEEKIKTIIEKDLNERNHFVCPKCGKGITMRAEAKFSDMCEILEKPDGEISREILSTNIYDNYVDSMDLECQSCNWSMHISRDSEEDDDKVKRVMKCKDGANYFFDRMEEIIGNF